MPDPFTTLRTAHFVERRVEPERGPVISMMMRENMGGEQTVLLTLRGEAFSADLYLDIDGVAALGAVCAATLADVRRDDVIEPFPAAEIDRSITRMGEAISAMLDVLETAP